MAPGRGTRPGASIPHAHAIDPERRRGCASTISTTRSGDGDRPDAGGTAGHLTPPRPGPRRSSSGAAGVAHARLPPDPGLAAPGDLLVVNDYRVIPARLRGTPTRRRRAELLLLRDLGDDRWEALVRPSRRVRLGEYLRLAGGDEVEVGEPGRGGHARVAFFAIPRGHGRRGRDAASAVHPRPIEPAGPLPDGLCAAARFRGGTTAGLHFTPDCSHRSRPVALAAQR